MSRDEIALVQTCPAPDELLAFNRGRLTLEKLEFIAEHLSHCERCESSLHSLQCEDTFLSHLRHPPAEEAVDEFAIVQLADRARAIAARDTDILTVAHDAAAEESKAPPLPTAFGAYLLLERLGHGGMGVVYKARQESLKRLVALKLVRAGIHASAEERARFQREGEAIARIKHPHVVQIHECGEHAGQPYFSMELLEGGTLADRLNGGPLPPRAAAELVRSLARAVQAAHQHEVVHRDLKPANVLFAADGTAKITDFGLARVLDSADNPTLTDVVLGTPAYMAPEQARGENRSIGPATDVYALGAILYETLTGQPPFRSETRIQTLELVRTCEPEPPTRRQPGLSRDLEAICLKCLEKKAAQRYATAEALKDDLDRWLRCEPTWARPLRRHQRVLRTLHRHRILTAVACLLSLAAALLAAIFYWRDPERTLENIQTRLHRGESVTLIGASGPPAWSEWTLRRQGGVVRSPRGDDAFALAAMEPAVLTLLRDPQGSYLFRTEVRHEDTTRLGGVGICFGHSRHATPDGVQHCCSLLIFDDIEVSPPDPKSGVKTSRLDWLLQRSTETFNTSTFLGTHYFPPASKEAPGRYPWRQLAAEVSPDRIRVFWEGKLVGEQNRQYIRAAAAALNNDEILGNGQPFALALQPPFSPRDALGLYVYRGKASFRNVVVKPLP